MTFPYPVRLRWLFPALLLGLHPSSASLARPAAPASALFAPADTAQRAPAPADTLPHATRDAQGRRADFTVGPGVTWHYDRPRPFRWLAHIPRDLGQFPAYAFRREHTETFIGLALGSLALWVADEPILAWSQDVGKQLGLAARSTQKTLIYIPIRVGSANLPFEFNVPDNLNSTFYYLGDGWTHLSVATGFWVVGGLRKDNRALQTSSQLGQAILSTGLMVQALKRSTGRQSPFASTKPRGEWHLFPSYSRYQNSVPSYDAFPTGHMATAMATVTVIADNYPEYRFVRPVGYSLIGLLGYSMLNNGVHWASDYPVGIALGYAFAKIAVRNGRTRAEAPAPNGPAAKETGLAPPPRPRPWYRQGRFAPYSYGPFAGASWSVQF